MNIEDIKTVNELDEYYTNERKKIEEIKGTNEVKALKLQQLNIAYSQILKSITK